MKSRKYWTPSGEKLLVKLWGERISALRKTKPNFHIYQEINKQLQMKGIHRTIPGIKLKLKYLKLRHQKEKEKIRRPGGTSSWSLYPAVDKILAYSRKTNVTSIDVNSSSDASDSQITDRNAKTTQNQSVPRRRQSHVYTDKDGNALSLARESSQTRKSKNVESNSIQHFNNPQTEKDRKDNLDRIDNFFLLYAETFKTFSSRTQAVLKVEMAQMFGQAELRELEATQSNHGTNFACFSSDIENLNENVYNIPPNDMSKLK